MLGRAETSPTARSFVFEGKRYPVGKTYRWSELPAVTRRDARSQTEDIQIHYGKDHRDVLYRLLLIPNADAEQLLRKRYGEEFDRIVNSPEIKRISEAIRRDGLKRSPILEEAIDEAIAMVALGLDVPYFDVAEPVLQPEHFIPTLEGARPQGRLRTQLLQLRSRIAGAVQKIYDEWKQDEEGVDEEVGCGGICDQVAQAIEGVIAEHIGDAELLQGGQDGDDHAWVIVARGPEAYGVDIPPNVYESGGGYRWKKKQGVAFEPEHVDVFPVELPESHERC